MAKKPTIEERRYTQWLIQEPCFACEIEDDTRIGHHFTFTKAGMAKKAPMREQLCLCHSCHMEKLHKHGERTFWQKLGYTEGQLLEIALQKYWHYMKYVKKK